MCGICAIVSPSGSINASLVRSMSDIARHRGPDDEGYVCFFGSELQPSVFGGSDTPRECFDRGTAGMRLRPIAGADADGARVGLGHRRLSIVDVGPLGHQPMVTPDGKIWVVYNGEIYNHLELREELEALGHSFSTRCDTEVALRGYAQWREKCTDRFNGMFAFIIVDLHRGRLFAARDRFGIKPLYYWFSPEGFVAFASEIKQFTVLPGWNPKINGQRVYEYLTWGLTDHSEETMFRDVSQLRGGECMGLSLEGGSPNSRGKPSINRTDVEISRWYRPVPRPFAGGSDEAAAQMRALLEDSVRLRLRADVAVGSCLSGGLDSTSIVCTVDELSARRNGGNPHHAFFAASTDKRWDESEYVDAVVAVREIDAHVVTPSVCSIRENHDNLAWTMDEPYGTTSIVAQWEVFRLASRHCVKVILDGQGADELLGGYFDFFGAHFSELFLQGRWNQLRKEMNAFSSIRGRSGGAAYRLLLKSLMPGAISLAARRAFGAIRPAPPWLNMRRLGAEPGDPTVAGNGRIKSVQDFSVSQLLSSPLPMLLRVEDRNSMAHSVESRLPFLDYRLAEFALGLPGEFKLSGGMTKQVLRSAMNGVIPEKIRKRPDKIGFATAEETWMKDDDTGFFRALTVNAIDGSRGVINPDALSVVDDVFSARARFSSVPWRLISFGLWMKAFGVGV